MAVKQVGMTDWGGVRTFQGLSTDVKPATVDNGTVKYIVGDQSAFLELDTKKVWVYDSANVNPATNDNWWEV